MNYRPKSFYIRDGNCGDRYQTIKILKETLSTLRLLRKETDETMLSIVERLVEEERVRIELEKELRNDID